MSTHLNLNLNSLLKYHQECTAEHRLDYKSYLGKHLSQFCSPQNMLL